MMKILELGFDAETIVDVDDSPLIAIYGFKVMVSSMYIPGYTLTVYVLFTAASVILSTAALIELNCVVLPTCPTVIKLSINVGGAYEADVALFAQLLVPINAPVKEPLNEPVLICSELDTTPTGNPLGNTNEAVIALDAVDANDAVPAKVPANDPLKLPVLIC